MRKALFVEARSVNHDSVVLPFDTDAQVCAAWRWMIDNERFHLLYNPAVDPFDLGHDALLRAAGEGRLRDIDAAVVRAVMPYLWGAETRGVVVDVVEPAL